MTDENALARAIGEAMDAGKDNDQILRMLSKIKDLTVEGPGILFWACYGGNLPITKYLVEQGMDVNAAEGVAISHAIDRKHWPVFEYLCSLEQLDLSIDDNETFQTAVWYI